MSLERMRGSIGLHLRVHQPCKLLLPTYGAQVYRHRQRPAGGLKGEFLGAYRAHWCRASKIESPETEMTSTSALPATSTSKSVLTLPTILTLARVVAIPLLIAVWFGKPGAAASTTGVIFLLACLTDFLDGYLARRMGTYSAFGAFLDPVADKLMVSTVLILLSSRPLASGLWAGNAFLVPLLTVVIIGREIAMSALREWAAAVGEEAHKAAAVSQLGKWKTTTQMVALTLLLFTSQGADSQALEFAAGLGTPLLCIATLLTVVSLYEYMRALWKYLF